MNDIKISAADPLPAQRVDATKHDHEPDRPMDFDKEFDFADQGPLTDMDMEKDEEASLQGRSCSGGGRRWLRIRLNTGL